MRNTVLHDNIALKRSPAGRLLLVGIMLLAFAVQGFVSQTHIHPQGFSDAGIVHKAGDGSSRRNNIPPNDDPANCPLCKEILHSGQFVAPLWVVFVLPALAVSRLETSVLAPARVGSVSHSWSSRAPPRR